MHDDVVEPTPLLLRLGMDAQFMGDFFGVTFLLGIEKHLRPGDSGQGYRHHQRLVWYGDWRRPDVSALWCVSDGLFSCRGLTWKVP